MSKYFKSFKEGISAEESFAHLCEARGYTVTRATLKEDTKDHIDLFVEKAGRKISVDVKAMKRLHRGGELDASIQWIEFLNVRGNDGWINGKADVIAFEDHDCFHLIKREVLLQYCTERCSLEEQHNPADMPPPAKREMYRAYRRTKYGKLDSVMIAELNDLKALTGSVTWERTRIKAA